MTSAEQIKSRLEVATVVGSYIKLDKAGVNFKARCPFHSEKSASFYVSPARDIWHCFGCGKGGDIFNFVMEMDGLDFPEALKVLADRAGIELTHEDTREKSERVKLLALLEEATDFFQRNLVANKQALGYLRERGLKSETMKEFRLGFAPDGWRTLGDHLKRKGYSDKDMERAGLSIAGNRGHYDRFRSRIIFPLEDALGRVIGFAGRIFGDNNTETAKYINTPQTTLYDKSRYLYGLGKAKNTIREQKHIIFVEGNMDVILSHQAGVANTVAVSGTALTESHLHMVKRLTDSILFALDVDSAGIAASRRALELAYANDYHVRIVDIKGGKDPADIVAKDAALWKKMVEGAEESISFFLKKAVGAKSLSDATQKKKIGEEILPLVARLSSEIEKAHWVGELSRVLHVGEDIIWRELGRFRSTDTKEVSPAFGETKTAQEKIPTRKARLEERILGLVLLSPQLAVLGDLPQKQDCSLATTGELFERLHKRTEKTTMEAFSASLPDDLKREAGRYLFEAEVFIENIEKHEEEFLNILHSWKELSLKEKLSKLHEEIKRLESSDNKEESQKYMQEFHTLTAHLASVVSRHTYHNEKETKKDNS